MSKPLVSVVVALGIRTRTIGNANKLLWDIPDDLVRFKQITSGHPVIMGRKTWESIPEKYKPLPDRTNIVVTRREKLNAHGAIVVSSLENAFKKAEELDKQEIFVIGGQQIYEQALAHIQKLYLTLVDSDKEGDTFFPDYKEFTEETFRENHTHKDLHYTWVNLERSAI